MEVRPGYKQTEVGVIPEDWDSQTIAKATRNILDYRGRTPRKLGMEWGGGHIPALSARNVKMGYINFDEECYFGSDALYRRWMTNGDIKKDDIIVTMEAPLGNVALIPDNRKYILSQRTVLLQLNPETTFNLFLFQAMLSQSFQRLLIENATGSTAQGIQRKKFEKLSVVRPPLPEQRAIAAALSDVDALLSELDAIIAKKHDLKQAAMQELLTGKRRLPGFSGEWKVKRLGDVVHTLPSGIYGNETAGDGLLAMPVATTAHISDDDVWNGKAMQPRFFTSEQIARYSVRKGDLVVVKSSGSAASIRSGKIGLVENSHAGAFVFSNFLMALRSVSMNSRFLYFYLTSYNVKKLLPSLVEASTYPNIRINEYLDIEIPVPLDDEQTAIASVLSDLNAELAALESRRDKTRDLKQGMMQELLTGRIRLV